MRAALFPLSGPSDRRRMSVRRTDDIAEGHPHGWPSLSGPQDAHRLRSIHHIRGIIHTVPNQQREIFAAEGMFAVVRFLIPDVIAEMAIVE